MLTKKEALTITRRLDSLANDVEQNWRSYGLDNKTAHQFCLEIDKVSDRVETVVGVRNAAVHERQPDEPYMDHFDEHGVLESEDSDEPYMDHYKEDDANQFANPLEGESEDELKNSEVEEDWYSFAEDVGADFSRSASTDYWDDSRKTSRRQAKSNRPRRDYW